MNERWFKTVFLCIFVLTLVWLSIVLIYLPQNDDAEQWSANLPPIQLHLKRGNLDEELEDSIPSREFSVSRATLFYQFNTQPEDLKNYSSISKDQHERITLELGRLKDESDVRVKTVGQKLFSFNLLVSNRIGLVRPLPDTRHAGCRNANQKHETSTLGHSQASIIICYFNEAPSALLRTIYSVLERSPPALLKEIIIVDDYSDPGFHFNLVRPLVTSEVVKFFRTSSREGLIRARLFGAKLAKGDVLIFLDSHVEANVSWLEPLIKTVNQNKTTIACPMIDLINAETFIYSASPMVRGGLNWALSFKWDSIPSEKLETYEDFVKPMESPTMAGGLYAINRDYFFQLGAYDAGMELWGGENVELSLRTWMCGGRIVILPCSRLGHIFRKKRPYGIKSDEPSSLAANSDRTARVWMDDYIYRFYEAYPEAKHLVKSDISERVKLREDLGCQNFSWFIDNIYPSLKTKKEYLQDNNHHRSKFKLFDLIPRRPELRLDQSINKTGGAISRSLRQISHPLISNRQTGLNREKNERLSWSYLPKKISQFQIQSTNGNLCIESKSSYMHKGFTRLILNHCAEVKKNIDGHILPNDSNILAQLWTETELHDLRLGDNQCLDLLKNLPLLRKCHNLSSFQDWNYYNQTSDTNIYNSRAGLCLGSEKTQVGEPIIVTICDRQRNRDSEKFNSGTLKKYDEHAFMSNWRTDSSSYFATKIFKDKPLRPCQRWNILLVNKSEIISSSTS